MTANPMRKFLDILRGTALQQEGKEQSDDQLLTRFVEDRDDLALETLVHRHAPMVWSVCRRNLTYQDDAEDAFQATFLVFFRKAASIRSRELPVLCQPVCAGLACGRRKPCSPCGGRMIGIAAAAGTGGRWLLVTPGLLGIE